MGFFVRCSRFEVGADEAGEHLEEDVASGRLERAPPLTRSREGVSWCPPPKLRLTLESSAF